ncbi:MAG TPA: 50S ribosomal protein L5 [Deltaproteobacteria bacterium]|nr:MAG: 50S ribosomal protein L5 [Deltaproteobacteria bacterium GWA2_55_82]OGQ65169.1 MAG: 50S ribosomal protein L5 [Deltaproteobacteria bacterium RIFCSPLOWO2_02_FULL_55_12]OIJ74705.1 MAG: 50S ribosomal protein L5 [Deltaproteobacteria bacterium GWC2_55_46]HBG45627.1 50S ribosomal protein L5 [Deltaproteobacteria bacterium]HCY12180.1 50S ribosomal protein L5 [Deltaproteobacteria bacterium]
MNPRVKEKYSKEVVPAMMKEFSYTSAMQVPKLEKVVLNIGLGEAVKDVKLIDAATRDLTAITGQKPVVTKAKKSIATFKLREGMPIGCMVTLRGPKMFEFFDRLVSFAIPRIRDFKGMPDKSFDGRGNYTIGVKEQIIFPEIEYDKIDKIRGLNITINTTAKSDEEAKALLKHLGMPFRS